MTEFGKQARELLAAMKGVETATTPFTDLSGRDIATGQEESDFETLREKLGAPLVEQIEKGTIWYEHVNSAPQRRSSAPALLRARSRATSSPHHAVGTTRVPKPIVDFVESVTRWRSASLLMYSHLRL
ncbi:hypothetical protein [Mesorhizobium loti]|uniref:hypothetical protein n=1 Tax=Rhizobium loti TaxID=381 RepID=UPI0007EF8B96|nr:hypothetical protein [Mesorhizobium loti]QKC73231.1 hypothetical protein EB815_31955 [Mesorhizobium loti]